MPNGSALSPAPECIVDCRYDHASEPCRCRTDGPARSETLRPTVISRVSDVRAAFPLEAIDLSAPISNAIVMLCMQALR